MLGVNTRTHTRDSGSKKKVELPGDSSIWQCAKNRHRLWNGSTVKQNGKIVEMIWLCLLFLWHLVSVVYVFLFHPLPSSVLFVWKCFRWIERKTSVARRTHMFLSWLWWDVISCRHRHAYKPWWQLPLFLSSCCPFRSFFFPFSAGKCHVDLAFPSTDSRFSSLMQTPLVLVCLFNEYTYCYVRNIHIRRQGRRLHPETPVRWWMSRLSPRTKGLTKLCLLDRRRVMFPPHLRPTYIRDTWRDWNWHPSPLFSSAHESAGRFFFFFFFFFWDGRSMDGCWISLALHWSFSVDRVRVS